MTEPFLCWCPLGIEQHVDGECPTRTEWLDVEDSEMHDLTPADFVTLTQADVDMIEMAMTVDADWLDYSPFDGEDDS